MMMPREVLTSPTLPVLGPPVPGMRTSMREISPFFSRSAATICSNRRA
jgi:hypothetical protein